MESVPFHEMDGLPDPGTAQFLLPKNLRGSGNSKQVGHVKAALGKGIQRCLTPAQRENLYAHYWKGLSKSEIAQNAGLTCSAVCKSLNAAKKQLEDYVRLYMEIADEIEKSHRGSETFSDNWEERY